MSLEYNRTRLLPNSFKKTYWQKSHTLLPSHACGINHEILRPPPERHDPAPNKRLTAGIMEVNHHPNLYLRILYPFLRQSLHNPAIKLGSVNSRKCNLLTQIIRQKLQQVAIPMAVQARGVEESGVFIIDFCVCVIGDGEFEVEGWLVLKLALL